MHGTTVNIKYKIVFGNPEGRHSNVRNLLKKKRIISKRILNGELGFGLDSADSV
jgi:hypothetical protein